MAEAAAGAESADDIRQKLARGVYLVRNKVGTAGHPVQSKCWAGDEPNKSGTFRVVVDSNNNDKEIPWVQCRVCLDIISHQKKASTNKLNRHSEKCKGTGAPAASSTPGIAPRASCTSTSAGSRPVTVSTMKKEFTQASVDFVVATGVAFNQLQGEEYTRVIQSSMELARQDLTLNAQDIIPHPTTLSRNISLSADRARFDLLPEVRESIEKCEASATTDMYTEDSTKISYIAVTLHYVDASKRRANIILFCCKFEGSHTAENIKETLLAEFASLGINADSVKKLTFISDNGANVRLALSSYKRLHCMAHAINLVLKNTFVMKLFNYNIWGEIGVILEDIVLWFTTKCHTGHQAFVRNLRKLVPKKTKGKYKSKRELYCFLLKNIDQVTNILRENGKEQMFRGLVKPDLEVAMTAVTHLEKVAATRKPAFSLRGSDYSFIEQFCQAQQDDTPLTSAYRAHIKDQLAALEALHVLDMCKKCVTYMKQSNHFTETVKKLQQEIEIRWNSHIPMLESIQCQFEEVCRILRESGVDYMNRVSKDQIEKLILFLKPFQLETKRIQGEDNPTFHFGDLSYHVLRNHCLEKATDEPVIRNLRARSLTLLIQYWTVSPEHRVASFLVPDFKRLSYLTPDARQEVLDLVRKECAITSITASELAEPSVSDGLDAFRDAENSIEQLDEVDRYLQEPAGKVENALVWWEANATRFPGLYSLARKLLGRPVTSAPCESVFSLAGFLISARRSRLTPETVNDMLFYWSFLRLQRRRAGLNTP